MSTPEIEVQIQASVREYPSGAPHEAFVVARLRGERGLAPGAPTRPPLSVVFVLDVSGSMSGPPIEHVGQAVDRLVGLLGAEDRIGIVAFSTRAVEVVALSEVNAETLRVVRRRTTRLVAEGSTNVEAGLLRARAMLPARRPHERQALLLLSDGEPNEGRASLSDLGGVVRGFRPDVGVSSLGFGAHHNEDILAGLADAGGGQYHFIPDPAQSQYELARALGQQGDIVADGVQLTLGLEPGVEVVRVIGNRPTRFGADGMVIELPDLLSGHEQVTVARVRITAPPQAGPFPLLRARLTCRPVGAEALHTVDQRLTAQATRRAGEPDPDVLAPVMLARADEVRGEARALADRGQFDGAAAVLRQFIGELRRLPGFSEGDGSALAEVAELLLDEAMALERRPSAESYKAFKRTSLTTQVSSQGTQASQVKALSEISRQLIVDASGAHPNAQLFGVGGPTTGQRFTLGADQVLGRTSTADIVLAHSSVSRKHARITAQAGRFLLIDLHSTNAVLLNGAQIHSSHLLSDGDVLAIGDCVLRYEES